MAVIWHLLQKRLWVFVFVTSVVDMAREGDVLSNLDSEVLRLRVEVGSALHLIKNQLIIN